MLWAGSPWEWLEMLLTLLFAYTDAYIKKMESRFPQNEDKLKSSELTARFFVISELGLKFPGRDEILTFVFRVMPFAICCIDIDLSRFFASITWSSIVVTRLWASGSSTENAVTLASFVFPFSLAPEGGMLAITA